MRFWFWGALVGAIIGCTVACDKGRFGTVWGESFYGCQNVVPQVACWGSKTYLSFGFTFERGDVTHSCAHVHTHKLICADTDMYVYVAAASAHRRGAHTSRPRVDCAAWRGQVAPQLHLGAPPQAARAHLTSACQAFAKRAPGRQNN